LHPTPGSPAPAARPERRRSFGPIVRVACGNTLEVYDFQIFGYYAAAIAATFFPSGNEFASLILALATYGTGFMMRPLGALVLGPYVDNRGRRAGLLLTLGLMAAGTISIACTPSYASIGLIAPLVVLAGRLVQGLSAGVEVGSASVYLYEIAAPSRRGFYTSWQAASGTSAVIFSAVLGLGLTSWLTAEQISRWGWRIPPLVGCAIIPLLFLLRRSLQETPEFLQNKRHPSPGEILRTVRRSWKLIALGALLSTMNMVCFYMVSAYTPTFGGAVLHLAAKNNMTVLLCVGASNFFWMPIMGAMSDRLGRRTLLGTASLLALLTAYPVLSWLVAAPSFSRLMTVELWISFLWATYNAAMIPFLTEIMPADVRTAGFSLAHSTASVFGGFTPAIATWLIHATGDRAAPGLWLSFAAVCGLSATLFLNPSRMARRSAMSASGT
jgi:MFS family permease